jgi:hypothetical protein
VSGVKPKRGHGRKETGKERDGGKGREKGTGETNVEKGERKSGTGESRRKFVE